MNEHLKINIGSGDSKIDGFITIDYDITTNPDYVLDLEKDTLPFNNDSVEHVIAHHILEHLGEGYIHCLKELYRVCIDNAIIDIIVPHHRHETFFADPTHKRPITAFGMSLFNKKINDYCKEQGFSNSRLGNYFDINFEIIEHFNIIDKQYEDFVKQFPEDEKEKYINLYNNIIENVCIKLKVVKSNNTSPKIFNYD